jgi:MFS superfamily sulfate permease-like transporter
MAKIKETKVQTTQWPNKRDKSFCLFYFAHCVVCAFLSFILAIVLSVILSLLFGHCVDRQHNGQIKRDKSTDNTMVKIKETKVQDNTMAKIKETKEQTTQWPK